ncbi:MAG: glycosyltransferase family 4 protein [Deltaproteobacteria bacterium]|nr:glycosyltransferase family 4 protein [Deltaproteobacteria bacterium]
METLLQVWGEQLALRGHEVTVLAASLSEKDEVQQDKDPRVVRLASFDPAKVQIRTLFEFRDALHAFFKEHSFDVMHLHNMFAPLTPLRTVLVFEEGVRHHIPMLMHSHCMNDTQMGKLLLSLSWDDVLFVSEWHRKETLGLYLPFKNTDVIYNGVRVDYFQKEKGNREQARRQIQASPDDCILLWPSRIVNPDGKPTTRKRLSTLLKAAARVKERTNTFKIMLMASAYGDEALQKRHLSAYDDLMKEGKLYENIVLLDTTHSYSYMRDTYAACDIMCLPSLDEVFGLVFIEAMAMEKIVIGANSGALPEIVDNGVNGYLIEPDNDQQLAELFLSIFEMGEGQRAEMGQRARQKVMDNFSSGHMIDDTLRIYEKYASP